MKKGFPPLLSFKKLKFVCSSCRENECAHYPQGVKHIEINVKASRVAFQPHLIVKRSDGRFFEQVLIKDDNTVVWQREIL